MTNVQPTTPPVSDDQRQQLLQGEIARYSRKGYAVVSANATSAVLSKRNRIGWFWNTVLSVFTGGLWLIVVIYKLVNRKSATVTVSIDQYGNVIRR